MIDATNEQLLSLRDAARSLPPRKSGKTPHLATLYRWTEKGLRGVVLETLQVGGTRCTSREALQRFFERLTEPQSPKRSHRTFAHKKASEELERYGV